MADLSTFSLNELIADADGRIRLRQIKAGLRQGQAHKLAETFEGDAKSLLVVGSGHVRGIDIFLPATTQSSARLRDSATVNRLRKWLDWLRGLGVVRLGELPPAQAEQTIPDRYLMDEGVRAVLGLRLQPACPPHSSISALATGSLEATIANAPPHSIAAILRDSLHASRFEEWLRGAERVHWPKLLVPLFGLTSPVETQSSGLSVGLAYWSSILAEDEFTLGQMTHITIDTAGWISYQHYPIDRFGLDWTPPVEAIDGRLHDAAYQRRDDLELNSVLGDIPGIVSAVLQEVSRSIEVVRCPSDDTPVAVKSMTEQFAEFVAAEVATSCAHIEQLIQDCAFPFFGKAKSVGVSRYLFADGDTRLQQRRLDANTAFPMVICDAVRGRSPLAAAAIDDGRPLLRTISAEHQCPLWAVRRTQRFFRHLGLSIPRELDGLSPVLSLITQLGPYAPEPDERSLLMLAKLVNCHQDYELAAFSAEWQMSALVLAVARQAQRVGWRATRISMGQVAPAVFGRHPIYTVMNYWDVMHENVKDVLDRNGLLPSRTDDEVIQSTLLEWLSATPLDRLLILSRRWETLVWNPHGEPEKERNGLPRATTDTPLFSRMSLIETQVEIQPLMTEKDLLGEAQIMGHCVASYSETVAARRMFIVSMSDETGFKATFSLQPLRDGGWREHELKGPNNAEIVSGSRLGKAATELMAYLNHARTTLDPDVLAHYQRQAFYRTAIAEYFQNGRSIIHGLPDALQAAAEPCFPGTGAIESRVLRAHAKRFGRPADTNADTYF